MQLLEEYEELIERDQSEISWLWKCIQMFLYLIGVISGYVCSILFYMLREYVFGGNCPLWAESDLMSEDEALTLDLISHRSNSNFWKLIITKYMYDIRCEIYLLTCFSSAIFGIVWFALFFMCGKGGHDIRIYTAPWRIVFPALFFNFVFAIICIYAHYNLIHGYMEFNTNIRNVAFEIYNIHHVSLDVSECEIIKAYLSTQYANLYNMCNVVTYIQILSAFMMWSWILGTLLLILRIIVANDFRLLKVYIYETKKE